LIEFGDADVQAMTHGRVQCLKLRTRHEVFDERVSRLTPDLADETLCGMPDGELYVQGLCVALLGALAKRYVACGDPQEQTRDRTLGTAQQRRLADLIRQQLGLSPPLCVYPQKVTYGGSGAITAAGGYTCQ